MIHAIKERIGKPSLFCGRKNEMQMLLNCNYSLNILIRDEMNNLKAYQAIYIMF